MEDFAVFRYVYFFIFLLIFHAFLLRNTEKTSFIGKKMFYVLITISVVKATINKMSREDRMFGLGLLNISNIL